MTVQQKTYISEFRELIRGFLQNEFGRQLPMEVDEGKEKRMGVAGGKERTLILVLPERYVQSTYQGQGEGVE
jgi:hypothetical protein